MKRTNYISNIYFKIQKDHPIQVIRKPTLVLTNKKKKACNIVYFIVLLDFKVNMKADEN